MKGRRSGIRNEVSDLGDSQGVDDFGECVWIFGVHVNGWDSGGERRVVLEEVK